MLRLITLLVLPSLVHSTQVSRLSVVCPEVGVPGQSTAVLVSLKESQPVNVTLRLTSTLLENVPPLKNVFADASEILAVNTVAIKGEGSVAVQVPLSRIRGEANLETFAGCTPDGYTCQPQITCNLKLIGPVRDVIIRPLSKYYKPGETVKFWVLALDHDLKVAEDVTGNVCVRDPSGTAVADWGEVHLDQVKPYELALSKKAAIGMWTIEVSVESSVFSQPLNLSLTRGYKDPVTPDLPIAEEHFVELRFSSEMRRRYKPSLPFVGKVEAVSSEKAVRVRVKVLDNTTSIYSQDIEMAGGEGSFFVPAVLSDSDQILLQAELVSVEGKEMDSHYVLAREPIYKWNSSTACYLLAEGMDSPLKPGDIAQPKILSSCPCDRHLHYVVTTEGHLTHWDESQVSSVSLPQSGMTKATLCRFNVTFKVEAVMAPVSHLLVYYVTDEGEPISDVISFKVKLLQRQVTVNLEQKKFWFPNELMDVQILTDLDSMTCLIGGRGEELHSRIAFGGVEMDFTEAGVGFHQWSPDGSNKTSKMSNSRHHLSIMSDIGLEQLWLWKCFNYTAQIEAEGLRINSPPAAGKWSLTALSVSPTVGLRYSTPEIIQVFTPLEVEFKLPTAFRVGESLEVDIKIGNNLNSCVDVNALLTLSEGTHFLGSSQPFVAEKLRLGPHGATSLVVRLVAALAGPKNLTVEVSAYHSETCQSVGSEKAGNHTLVGTIVKQETILVNPEGLVKTHIESAYFCANEQMVVSTEKDFRYEFIPAPRNREGLVFEVRAGQGVHVALSEVEGLSQRMYQIAIGDQGNTVSWLARGKHGYSVHLMTAKTPDILSSDESRTFWLSWNRGAIAFGPGSAVHEKTTIKWKVEKRMKVNFIGFATSWGRPAEFRIWNFNDEAGFSQVIHLDIPRSVLPGSETGMLMVAGGLQFPYLGSNARPSLSAYSSLATVVSNVASFAARLMSISNSSDIDKENIRRNLQTSFQELLRFRKKDGSFSDHSHVPSLWSSVEVLDLLTRVQGFVGIDPTVITELKKWVQAQQADNGGFKPKEMDVAADNLTWVGEPSRTIATTAMTLITLVNIGVENKADALVISKTREYLESRSNTEISDSVTLAVLCHSLVVSSSSKASWMLDRLKNASTNEEGEFGWPKQRDNSDWLYEEGVEQKKQPVTSHLIEFKASLYALMTYTKLGDLKSAEPVARYLFYRANILDTHAELISVAVKAFSDFGKLALDENRWLTVSLATSGMELTDTLELRADSQPQLLNLPSLPTKVFVYATGGGCATVQGRISYATYSPSRSNSLLDLWAGITEEILPRRNSIQELEGKLPTLNLKICFRWKGAMPSGVIRVEVHLFSGFELVSVAPSQFDLDYGSRGDQTWFVVNNAASNCDVCIEFTAKSEYIVSRLRPGLARVYPAGRSDLVSELFFHTKKGSPLLAGTSDDDLITWFGSSNAGVIDGVSSDFSELCACGHECKGGSTQRPTVAATQEEDDRTGADDLNDFTDIIVFSDLSENLSTTEGEFGSLEDIAKELDFNTTSDSSNIESTTQETTTTVETTTTSPKPTKKKFTPSKKASLKDSKIPMRVKHIDTPPNMDIEQSYVSLNREIYNVTQPPLNMTEVISDPKTSADKAKDRTAGPLRDGSAFG